MLNIRRETNVKLLLNIFNVLIMNLLEKNFRFKYCHATKTSPRKIHKFLSLLKNVIVFFILTCFFVYLNKLIDC